MSGSTGRMYDIITLLLHVINIQKSVIDKLFEGLMQHMAAEDVERDYAKEIKMINEAADLRKSIEQ